MRMEHIRESAQNSDLVVVEHAKECVQLLEFAPL